MECMVLKIGKKFIKREPNASCASRNKIYTDYVKWNKGNLGIVCRLFLKCER